MNFYLEALQNEHILLKNALASYEEPISRVAEKIKSLFKNGTAQRIVFAGMGSSLYAVKSIQAKLSRASFFCMAVNCFEMLTQMPELADKNTILVLVSQSGDTPEILQMMEYAKTKAAMTVAVLNEKGCRMEGLADEELFLSVGKETPISNKTYYAQVALLNLLAGAVIGEDVSEIRKEIIQAVSWHGDYCSLQEERTKPLLEFIKGSRQLELLGDGPQGGAAMQAGLVWREMPRLDAMYFSSSDFSHGWFDIAKPGYTAVFLCSSISSLDKKMIHQCLEQGAKAVLMSSEEISFTHDRLMKLQLPKVREELLPLYSIVPLYFAAGILAETEGNGYEVSGN